MVTKITSDTLKNKDQGVLIEKIQKVMIDYVYHTEEKEMINFSSLLSKKLNYSYGYLANFFSVMEATTIEQRLIIMKVERIKELMMCEENSIKDISRKLHYSSVAHLSSQFKKVTGLTPAQFKNLKREKILPTSPTDDITQTNQLHKINLNMKKYEYDWNDIVDDKQHSELLKERGDQGWRMVCSVIIEQTQRIYWEREITATPGS